MAKSLVKNICPRSRPHLTIIGIRCPDRIVDICITAILRMVELHPFALSGRAAFGRLPRKGKRLVVVTKRCSRESGCLTIPGASVPIRNRERVDSPSLRKPDVLPPVEIRAAILALIGSHFGASKREIPMAVARMFGFKSTSGPLRAVIEAQLAKLLRTGSIREVNGMIQRSESVPTE